MSSKDETQLMPAPLWSDPRVHLLDDTWLLTIFAILFATVIPWLVSSLDINFLTACLGLLALGAVHIGFSIIGRPARSGERRPALAALHVLGIVIVGFIWLQVGGLQNPGFLIVFALPVVGSIFLSRWQPYLMALLAIVVVGAVALAQAPELRWYAPGLNAAGAWLASVLGQDGSASAPFAGFYAPSGYFVVLLEVFAILVLACAVASEYLGSIFERLNAHVEMARSEAERGQEFWASLIEDLPVPALLVDADTSDVLCASGRAAEYAHGDIVTGRSLFETVKFSYPDVVQELITHTDGVSPFSMIRIGDRLRAAEVHVRHMAQRGRRFALVVIKDTTDELTIGAALDVTGQAVLVIDAQARVLAFNKPAQALFATIEKGEDASRLLTLADLPPRWWEPGISGRRKMHLELGPRVYQVTCSASPLPGEEEPLFIVTFLPVARAAITERTGSTMTARIVNGTRVTSSNPSMASPP